MSVTRVSVAEYAKMRGVSPQAVNKAIRTGRIAAAVSADRAIDPEHADRLWVANTNPDQGHHGHVASRAKTQADEEVEEIKKLAVAAGVDLSALPSLVESKTIEAAYKAKLAQLDYEERSGKLIDMDLVKRQAFKLARLTRDAMLAIPDRVSAELAGVTDAFEIHRKLMAEIRTGITEVSKVVDGGGGA